MGVGVAGRSGVGGGPPPNIKMSSINCVKLLSITIDLDDHFHDHLVGLIIVTGLNKLYDCMFSPCRWP